MRRVRSYEQKKAIVQANPSDVALLKTYTEMVESLRVQTEIVEKFLSEVSVLLSSCCRRRRACVLF